MKLYKVTVAAFAMMFAVINDVNAQNDLGNFLGNIIEQSKKNNSNDKQDDNKKGSIFDGLSNIFNKNKIATADDLVGIWKFSGPAVILESENALENMGGKLAAKRMEDRINEVLNKYGLTKDAMTFEFKEDRSFEQKYRRLDLRGTYSVEEKNVTLKYAGKYKQLIGDTQIDGKNLIIVMDLERLNDYIVNIASLSPDPKAQMLSKILSRIKGIKVGLRFEKQN